MLRLAPTRRDEETVPDRRESTLFITNDGEYPVWVESMTLDTLRISQKPLQLGTAGLVDIEGVGRVRCNVVEAEGNLMHLALQTTSEQKNALLLWLTLQASQAPG